jgi:hypothetical protein
MSFGTNNKERRNNVKPEKKDDDCGVVSNTAGRWSVSTGRSCENVESELLVVDVYTVVVYSAGGLCIVLPF